MNKLIQAYNKINEAIDSVVDIVDEDTYESIYRIIKEKIECEKLQDLFGISLKGKYVNSGYVDLYNDIHLILMGEKHGRTINWSDDGSQPNDEWLLSVSYPTGAYIFGDSYPKSLFQEYFLELKAIGAKYCDTANHRLYFNHENAKEVYDSKDDIFKKYKGKLKEFLEAEEVIKIRKRLDELENK